MFLRLFILLFFLFPRFHQAIAIVCGFLVVAALIVMLVFALKTRQKIRGFGKSNILWKKIKVVDELAPPGDVEAWVSTTASSRFSPSLFEPFFTIATFCLNALVQRHLGSVF